MRNIPSYHRLQFSEYSSWSFAWSKRTSSVLQLADRSFLLPRQQSSGRDHGLGIVFSSHFLGENSPGRLLLYVQSSVNQECLLTESHRLDWNWKSIHPDLKADSVCDDSFGLCRTAFPRRFWIAIFVGYQYHFSIFHSSWNFSRVLRAKSSRRVGTLTTFQTEGMTWHVLSTASCLRRCPSWWKKKNSWNACLLLGSLW